MRSCTRRLVVQLVVPAPELLAAGDAVHRLLHLAAQRRRPDQPDLQLGGAQLGQVARVVAEAGQQHGRVGAVVGDQVAAAAVLGGEQALAQGKDHVLLVVVPGLQALEVAVEPARRARQAGVVGVVVEVGRDQAELGAIGIALVLAFAAEQVVVHPQVHRRRGLAQAAVAAFAGQGRGGQQEQGAGQGRVQVPERHGHGGFPVRPWPSGGAARGEHAPNAVLRPRPAWVRLPSAR